MIIVWTTGAIQPPYTGESGNHVWNWIGAPVAIISGPYSTAALALFAPGVSEAELFAPGATAAELYGPGIEEVELN